MTKKLTIFAIIAFVFLVVSLNSSMARYPKAWNAIKLGENIENIMAAIPLIKLDKKEGEIKTWYNARTKTRSFLISFDWHMDITTDKNGVILDYHGRSYNKISGLFDQHFNVITDKNE